MATNGHLGMSLEELSQEELDFVTGAAGNKDPAATPTIMASSAPCSVEVSKLISGATASLAASFTAPVA